MVCVPCLAAAGPPGIAVAAIGTVGYGAYKYSSPKKKITKGKKNTKRKGKNGKNGVWKQGGGRKGGGKQDKFKMGEIVRFITNDGKKQNMKFMKYMPKNKISIKFPNAKKKYDPVLNVDAINIEKLPKNIANTKLRQRTKRAALVRKKRGIKTKSSTLELPSSPKSRDSSKSPESIDELLNDMKL
jgi:hypothetical protein